MARSQRSGLPKALTATYTPVVRNAIVHGGVSFGEYNVTFADINGSVEVMSYSDAERLSHRLLDTCNAISAALVFGLATGEPLAGQMPLWGRTERALALARTAFTTPDACYVTDRAGVIQAEMHGKHTHWFFDHLLTDVMRAAVIMKAIFTNAARYFISFSSPRGAPCFFNIPSELIPERKEPFATLKRLGDSLGTHGGAWIEHETIAQTVLSKTSLGAWFNWIETIDRETEPIDYELRELRNISAGWHSRFEAFVVSAPKPTDLRDDGTPTQRYLDAIFNQTLYRWTFRKAGARPLGVSRIRIFHTAIIHVYHKDRRKLELAGSGLGENLLFRFQLALGRGVGVPLLGSKWEQLGPFQLTMNVAGHGVMKKIKTAST